jgi:hypothetical protein
LNYGLEHASSHESAEYNKLVQQYFKFKPEQAANAERL